VSALDTDRFRTMLEDERGRVVAAIDNLHNEHPGSISDETGEDVESVRRAMAAGVPTGRFGTPEEFGAACAFLCSTHAGYIVGQNILLDGGLYPGTF